MKKVWILAEKTLEQIRPLQMGPWPGEEETGEGLAVFRRGGSPTARGEWPGSKRRSRRTYWCARMGAGWLGRGLSVMAQHVAVGVLIDGVVPAGERLGEVGEKLHWVMAKLSEGLWWSGRGCGGLSAADRGCRTCKGRRRWWMAVSRGQSRLFIGSGGRR